MTSTSYDLLAVLYDVWATRLICFKGDYDFSNSTATLSETAKAVITSYEKNWLLP